MKILALDLARTTGVAVGDHSGAPVCSTHSLGPAKSSHALVCGEAMRLINTLLTRHQPDAVAIESVYIDQRNPQKIRAAILLHKIHGAVLGVCNVHGLHPFEYTAQECRKHFISAGTLGRAEAKATVMSMCGVLGWKVDNDNEADACAVWEMHRAKERLSNMMPEGWQ